MARWQRHARLGFGLFAIAFAVALWFVIGRRQPPCVLRPLSGWIPKRFRR